MLYQLKKGARLYQVTERTEPPGIGGWFSINGKVAVRWATLMQEAPKYGLFLEQTSFIHWYKESGFAHSEIKKMHEEACVLLLIGELRAYVLNSDVESLTEAEEEALASSG